MKKLLIAALLVALLFTVGWLSFRYDGRQASVSFNADEARQDTRQLAEKGREVVDQAAARTRDAIEKQDDRTPPAPAQGTTSHEVR